MTRTEAIEIAREQARLHQPSYYAEPFVPHSWVVDAIMTAYADGFSDGYDHAVMIEVGDTE